MLGVAACLVPSILSCLFLPKLADHLGDHTITRAEAHSNAFAWLFGNPQLVKMLLYYVVSLTVFKIWIILVPYHIREGLLPSISASYLMLILTIHPFVFSAAQYVVGVILHKFSDNDKMNAFLVGLFTVLQGLVTWLCLSLNSPILFGLVLLIGGGVLSATLYPLLAKVWMKNLNGQNPVVRRHAMLMLSVGADIGQLVASPILALTIFTFPMANIFLPIGIILLVMMLPIRKVNYRPQMSVKGVRYES